MSPRRSQMRFSSPAGPLGKQAALIPVLTQPFSFLLWGGRPKLYSLSHPLPVHHGPGGTALLSPPTLEYRGTGEKHSLEKSSPGCSLGSHKCNTSASHQVASITCSEYSADPSTHRSAASFSFSFCLQSEKELIHQGSAAPAPAPAPAPNAAHREQQQEAP